MLLTKKTLLLSAIILLAVLIPQHFARAISPCAPLPTFDLANCAVDIFNIPLYVIAWLLGFVASLLNEFIAVTGTIMMPAVKESWTILRDFVNMFFILVLIIMAFGTIFDIKKYTWREMLIPFLVAALLINFSFVIGEYVISIGNGLSGVFLKQIGATGLKDRLGQGLGMQKLITTEGKDLTGRAFSAIGGVASVYQQLITIIFFIVFGAIALLAMVAAFIFVFIRIPILWMFLIVSPVAWFGYTLPNIRAQTWSAWWHHFIRWVFFLPVYLFFLMFGFIFIAAKSGTQQLIASATLGEAALILINDIVFYIITLIFLAGGLWASFKVGGIAGSGAAQLMGKVEGGVKKYFPGAGYVRAIGAGAKEGLKARGEEIKEKGVFGIGGAQAERLRQAKWTERFGFGAARGAAERARLAEIDKEKVKLQQELQRKPADEQKQFLLDAQNRKGVAGEAALFEYVKQGYSTLEDYKGTMKKFGGETTALGRQYLENLKSAKLSDLFKSPEEERRIARQTDPEITALRRELVKDLAKRNQITTLEDYKMAKELLSPIPTELKSFLESIKPEYIVATKEARQEAIKTGGIGDRDLEMKLVEFMKDKKEINSVELRQNALEIVGGKNTIEGRSVINEINKFNPVINIEADLREEKGIPVDRLLSDEDNNRIIGEIADKIAEKEFADLRKMSGKFWEDARTQQAVRKTFDGDDVAQLLEGAPKEMKRALKNVSRRGPTAGGGEARRSVGFVPPGSTVTPEGKVVPPEEK